MDNLQCVSRNYLNNKLQQATSAIQKYDFNIRGNQFAIAHVMGQVDELKLYEDDGFRNACAWAVDAFGIQKSLAYNLITIGREYTREVRNGKGKLIGYCSNLIFVPDGQAPVIDYSMSQLARLATLGRDTVVSLHNEGTIKPTMTVKEISDIIKAHKALNAAKEEQPAEVEEQPAEVEEQPAEEQPAEEQPTVYNIGKRFAMFDDMSTDKLIAELRLRGFKVTNQLGEEMSFAWSE